MIVVQDGDDNYITETAHLFEVVGEVSNPDVLQRERHGCWLRSDQFPCRPRRSGRRGGPGQVHFQAGLCDSEFFAQLTSEVPSRRWKDGKPFRVWIPKTGVRNEVRDCAQYCLAARMSLPFSDGMLQPPKTIYVDEKGDQILRGKKKVEPTTEFDIDKVSPFPQPVKKRKSLAGKLAGWNQSSSQGNMSSGWGR